MAISSCLKAFILTVLCGNPIMKGAVVSSLTGILFTLDAEIALATAELGRLNVFNAFLSLEILTIKAILNKVSADLNLILGPFSDSASCPEVAEVIEKLQEGAVNKKISGFINKLYEQQRVLNLAVIQDAIIKKKNAQRDRIVEFINSINTLCP